MKKKFLEIGKIVTTHGVVGEVKVYPWCDTPDFLTGFSTLYFHKGKDPVLVQQARVHKNMVLLKLQGTDTLEAAQALRNQILYADRADMPLEEGEYFIQDLIGLTVVDADTEIAGYTAGQCDVDGGVMRIRPLKGLFDDAD